MQPKQPYSPSSLDHERLVSLINSMADGVLAVDETGKIVVYNGAALNILDINTTLTNRPLSAIGAIIDKNDKPVDVVRLVLNAKLPETHRDLRLRYSDNSTINLYISIAPVRLGYGEMGMKGYVLLIRDITREKSLEEERDEFISVVSHELRTPIAIAEGNISNAQFIAEQEGDLTAIKAALVKAHDQITFLSGMVNDLAMLSRAERGRLTVELSDVNAHQLISDLVEAYKPEANGKKLELNCELDPKLELLRTSKLYLREILQNFVTNAIKYTEHGSITISAHQKDAGIQFEVADTGIGISKPDQEKIFQKFFRSEDYKTRSTNGTGLGLYVTKKLADLLKATISVASEPGSGSVFSILVPNLK